MTKTSLIFIAFGWAAANLAGYAVVLFSDRPAQHRGAEALLKFSRQLLVVCITILIAEVWWQEFVMAFSASPTPQLTVPIQDHGTKYVSPVDAGITDLFHSAFFLMSLPFLSLFLGERARTAISGVDKPEH